MGRDVRCLLCRFDMCTHGTEFVLGRAVMDASDSVEYEYDVSYTYMRLLIATFF
jgi:hypothetical protein